MPTTKQPPARLRMTPVEAATYTGLTLRNLKRYRHERRIPYYRLGHVTVVFDVRDLDAFLEQNRVEAIGFTRPYKSLNHF